MIRYSLALLVLLASTAGLRRSRFRTKASRSGNPSQSATRSDGNRWRLWMARGAVRLRSSRPQARDHELTHRRNVVGSFLGGSVKVVEGKGYEADGRVRL